MKLIADGGSTKTDWRLITGDNNTVISLTSPGINPFHCTEDEMDTILAKLDLPNQDLTISEIFFYGAGIAGKRAATMIESALQRRFGPTSVIAVGDDLIAAARALFGDNDGIACILGTGSNSCLYRNGTIERKIPALGYILGDEGSGTDMGKRFINALFKNDFPAELQNEILSNERLNMHAVLDLVYRSDYPARELASFSKIIIKYVHHEPVLNIVSEALNAFFAKNVSKYEDYRSLRTGFAGSIAFHFSKILEQTAIKWGIETIRIVPAPIDELVNYHTK
jgi:glucosamine kinase